jgi:hypothetical protein
MIAKAMRAIGERDGDKLKGLGLHEPLREGSQRVFVWLAMIRRVRRIDHGWPEQRRFLAFAA